MQVLMSTNQSQSQNQDPGEFTALLAAAVLAVQRAGVHLVGRFNTNPRAENLDDLVRQIHANDHASLAILRPALEAAWPNAGWVEDELEGGALPDGDWWIVDPVEGNINHVQGLAEWGVSATLVRNNQPVLTAIDLPLAGLTYTAVKGKGAFENDRQLRVSAKSDMSAAIFATGQARPGESKETHRLIGASVTAMLDAALVVRVTVPATFQLMNVAGGHIDGFWQHSQVRSGLAAGALMVAEAGGSTTDIHGTPWSLESTGFLATNFKLQAAAAAVLGKVTS